MNRLAVREEKIGSVGKVAGSWRKAAVGGGVAKKKEAGGEKQEGDRGAKNLVELGGKVGISGEAARKLRKREDWPVNREGPWGAEAVTKFIGWHRDLHAVRAGFDPADLARHTGGTNKEGDKQEEGEGGGGVGGEGGKALSIDLQLKKERTLKLRLEREILARKYIRRELLDKGFTELATLFVRELDGAEAALPLALAELPPDQIEAKLRIYFREIRNRLAGLTAIEVQVAGSDVPMAEGLGAGGGDKLATDGHGLTRMGVEMGGGVGRNGKGSGVVGSVDKGEKGKDRRKTKNSKPRRGNK